MGPLNPDHVQPGWGVPSVLKTPNDWRLAGRALHEGVEEQRHGELTHRLADKLTTNDVGHPMWRQAPPAQSVLSKLGVLHARAPRSSATGCREDAASDVGPSDDTHSGAKEGKRAGIELGGFASLVKHAKAQAQMKKRQEAQQLEEENKVRREAAQVPEQIEHDPIWRPGGPVGVLNPDHVQPGWGVPSVLKTPNDWRSEGRALHEGVEEQRHGVLTHRLEDQLTIDEHGHHAWKRIPAARQLAIAARLCGRSARDSRGSRESKTASDRESSTDGDRGNNDDQRTQTEGAIDERPAVNTTDVSSRVSRSAPQPPAPQLNWQMRRGAVEPALASVVKHACEREHGLRVGDQTDSKSQTGRASASAASKPHANRWQKRCAHNVRAVVDPQGTLSSEGRTTADDD